MKCEVDYCIYNRDYFCLLKEIQINFLGIADDVLKELKESQLEEIDSQWKDYG